jgi:hypothetical protein
LTARTAIQRKKDTLDLLTREVDLWIATANADADVHLIPLSFVWDDDVLTMATPEQSVTVDNLRRSGRTRVAIGPTRDVVIVEGSVRIIRPESAPDLAEIHARHVGFDARSSEDGFVLMILMPETIQAWRTPAELPGRVIMRDGRWLA